MTTTMGIGRRSEAVLGRVDRAAAPVELGAMGRLSRKDLRGLRWALAANVAAWLLLFAGLRAVVSLAIS